LPKFFTNDSRLIILGGTDNFERFSEVLDKTTYFHNDEDTLKLQAALGKTMAFLNFNCNFLRPNAIV
jgi:hypothetical protein